MFTGSTKLSSQQKEHYARQMDIVDGMKNSALYGDEELLTAGVVGLGAAHNSQAMKNLNIANKSYQTNMKNLVDDLESGKVDERIFTLRAKAEGIKVRLAFKMASLVQGLSLIHI